MRADLVNCLTVLNTADHSTYDERLRWSGVLVGHAFLRRCACRGLCLLLAFLRIDDESFSTAASRTSRAKPTSASCFSLTLSSRKARELISFNVYSRSVLQLDPHRSTSSKTTPTRPRGRTTSEATIPVDPRS